MTMTTKDMQNLFNSLPGKWRKAIVRVLEKAGVKLPLYAEEITALQLTLQCTGNGCV
jgi:hypothetical protein